MSGVGAGAGATTADARSESKLPKEEHDLVPSAPVETKYSDAIDVDKIIRELWSLEGKQPMAYSRLNERDFINLALAAREVFKRQPVLLELNAPVNILGETHRETCTRATPTHTHDHTYTHILVLGDIHGQYTDLMRWFRMGGMPSDGDDRDWSYLFLGDYIDRGPQSLEVIALLFAYKVKYPERIWLLRGNHECVAVNWEYGFYEDCKDTH